MPRKTCERCGDLRSLTLASMRPRPDATENMVTYQRPGRIHAGFNEAAARCHGKPAHPPRSRGHGAASMRPRPDATENVPVIRAAFCVLPLQ